MTSGVQSQEPIACTLDAHDMRLRLDRIRALSMRALLTRKLDDGTLHLHFAPWAGAKVRALVDAERECCAFLTFDLTEAPDGVRLIIVAPAQAVEWSSLMFSHFARQTDPATVVATPATTCCGRTSAA